MRLKKLSAQLATPAQEEDLEQRLDQLIPAPAGPGKKLLWGTTIVSLALAATILNVSGALYPKPTFGGSYSSGYSLEVNKAEQWVTAKVTMPNFSQRSVRITDIELDAPGATLVDFGVILEPAVEGSLVNEGDESSVAVATEVGPDVLVNLPLTVKPGDTAVLVLRFRPDDCGKAVDPTGAWGFARATLDFGDGAFPPISRTLRIDQDSIVQNNEQLTFVKPDGEIINILADGTMIEVGVLTGACEALQ